MNDFESVVGLEIHAQLSTKTKLFCNCSTDSFGKEPNTNVCPICMGFPGMLPVTNKDAIKKGLIACLALNCKIGEKSKFDRKNYFYPDLPSGYQISQFDEPLGLKGYLEIRINGEKKKIGITRLHIENDAGKLSHEKNGTLLDFNRAGTGLAEIVSEPEIRNSTEARVYAEAMHQLLRYCGCSEVDMEKGMMRFDASVSIRPIGETKLYPRAEIKNLNSFKSLESAIDYEISRQINLWKEGNPITTEVTVGWDEEKQMTKLLREKESAADYRYFPEPDLPPLIVSEELLNECNKLLPELPHAKYERYIRDYSLSESEAEFYIENQSIGDFFEEVAKKAKNPASANSFVATVLISKLKETGEALLDCKINAEDLAELIVLIDSGTISNNIAKNDVLNEMLKTGDKPKSIVEKMGLSQISDSNEINELCKKAIDSNSKAVEDYKSGNQKAIGALVGMVIKMSGGKANPKMVNDILIKLLV